MHITILNVIGQKYLTASLDESALKKHTEARELTESLDQYEKENKLAKGLTAEGFESLLPTTIFFQAQVYEKNEYFQEAAIYYEEAVQVHHRTGNFFSEVETCYRAGLNYQKAEKIEHTWRIYNHALTIAEKVEEALLEKSSLSLIANEMLALAEPLGLMESRIIIRQKMILLLGNKWSEKLEKSD